MSVPPRVRKSSPKVQSYCSATNLTRGLIPRACREDGGPEPGEEVLELPLEIQVIHHVVDPESVDAVVEAAVPVRIHHRPEQGLEVPSHLGAVEIDGRDREPVAVIDRHHAQVEDPRLGLRVPRAVVQHVASVLRSGLSQRLPQPRMVLGDVLDLLIQIDLHPSRMHRLHQLPVGGQVPVVPVHPFEARREIVVVERRRIDRREQDGRRAEVLDVSQLLGDAAEIADPVAVAVPEAADEDVVEDLVLRGRRGGAGGFDRS